MDAEIDSSTAPFRHMILSYIDELRESFSKKAAWAGRYHEESRENIILVQSQLRVCMIMPN